MSNKAVTSRTSQVAVRWPVELLDKARAIAVRDQLTVSRVLIRAAEVYLAGHGVKMTTAARAGNKENER